MPSRSRLSPFFLSASLLFGTSSLALADEQTSSVREIRELYDQSETVTYEPQGNTVTVIFEDASGAQTSQQITCDTLDAFRALALRRAIFDRRSPLAVLANFDGPSRTCER